MTVEEAKVKYGDPNMDGYVWCEKCPLSDKVLCCNYETGMCDGRKKTWKLIADHFNSLPTDDNELDIKCLTCTHEHLDIEHPTCFECGRHGVDNYEEKDCMNCKYNDKDFWEEPCKECNADNNKWESPYCVPEVDKPTEPTNNVDHPSHYTQGGIECIDAMTSAFGKEAVKHFCICNAFKYIFRHQHKNGLEDINKAFWYLNKYKELEYGVVETDR